MSNLNTNELISFLSENYGSEISSNAVKSAADEFNVSYPTITKRLEQYKVGHGRWNLTVQERLEQTYQASSAVPERESIDLIPIKDATFVPFGNFADVKKVIQSGLFYPMFITGLSGNGKTFGVEQACASLNRELVRVNITIETDEDDLIGGFRLVNGETV